MAASHAELLTPSMDYNQFMGFTETVNLRPMDHLVQSINPAEAVDLVASGNVIAGIVEKEAPDIVFYPQRGAGPSQWICDEILTQRGVAKPLSIDLPTGTRSHIETRQEAGLSDEQKTAIINETLDILEAQGVYKPGKSKLMIIDEAQRGATLTQAATALKDAMAKKGDANELSVVAVQDSRNRSSDFRRTAGFKQLAANEQEGFATYTIPTTLFTVDRARYLDVIASDLNGKNSKGKLLSHFQMIENREAREIFRALARAYCYPEDAKEELHMMKQSDLADDLGKTVLQYPVADALTDPREIERRKSEHRIFKWWETAVNQIQAQRLSQEQIAA